jgi:hypothetical protein
MEIVVECSLIVKVSIRGGMLTMTGSLWGKKRNYLKKKNKKKNYCSLHSAMVAA